MLAIIVFLQTIIQVTGQDFQPPIKLLVVIDHQVGFVHIWFDVPFEGRQYMMLVAIEDVVQRVIALYLVPFDPADDFEVFLSVEEDLYIQQPAYFFEVENEDAFDDDDRRRPKSKHSWLDGSIIKGILLAVYRLAGGQAIDIFSKGFFINRARQVKIADAHFIFHLLFSGPVVIILRDDAKVLLSKPLPELVDEGCFSGTTTSCDPNNQWFHNCSGAGFHKGSILKAELEEQILKNRILLSKQQNFITFGRSTYPSLPDAGVTAPYALKLD